MGTKIDILKPEILETDIDLILKGHVALYLDQQSRNLINSSHLYLQDKIKRANRPIYGINTGFGSLCNIVIEDKDLSNLQVNLIRSHAAGLGEIVSTEITRLILFLKIRSLSYGYSGVSLELVERLINMYHQDALPVIYELGSLGASGDLAPLAHLSLPLIGEGKIRYKGSIISAEQWLEDCKLPKYQLNAKEGLALINGTQFSLAHLVYANHLGKKLQRTALVSAALSMEGFDCTIQSFDPLIQKIRPGNGQPEIAEVIQTLLKDSPNISQPKSAVQDPYSFRCIPQVHGATWRALSHIQSVIDAEINSVTDNPGVFQAEDKVISGGNFHAQPLALASDYLAIALAELANISERRVYLLISGQRGLPPFLTNSSGLESGFMIAQYTAASIVSQNKQLCTPASVDSIVSSNGQEDHVSMAANAGVKAVQVAKNLERVLAIEFQIGCQAVEMRAVKSSRTIQDIIGRYRSWVTLLTKDRIIHDDFVRTVEYFQLEDFFTQDVKL